MYPTIIALSFIMALRGTRPAALQRPLEGLRRVWRDAIDLFLTLSLILVLAAGAAALYSTRVTGVEYEFLGFSAAAYLLSRYQKKTDIFFLVATLIAFTIHGKKSDLLSGLSLAWAVSVCSGFFQTGLLGLRYRLLFSGVPASMRGWPMLCLLAGFLSVVLWSVAKLVF